MKLKINRANLIVIFSLIVLWLLGLLVFDNYYKAVELELVFTYLIVFLFIGRNNGFYGETSLFLMTYGLFLCSHPFMDLIGISKLNESSKLMYSFVVMPEECLIEALNAIIITLITIMLTNSLFDSKQVNLSYCMKDRGLPKYFRRFFIIVFILALVFRIAEAVTFQLMGSSYLDLFAENYTNKSLDKFSFIVTFFEVLFYIALAQNTVKSETKLYIFLYLFTYIPLLVMGRRAPIIVSLIFVVWYYCNFINKIKFCYILPTALLVVFASEVVGDFRNNNVITSNSLSVINFIESQNGTFYLVAMVSFLYDTLQAENTIGIPYFLGMVHKFLVYVFDRITFTDSVFGHGQSIAALNSSSYLGWKLTYLLAPHQYILGRGVGSSFVAENFLFYKYFGCVVLTFLMFYLIYWLKNKFISGNNIYLSCMFFVVVKSLFFSPRNNFWICISSIALVTLVVFIYEILMPRIFKHKQT